MRRTDVWAQAVRVRDGARVRGGVRVRALLAGTSKDTPNITGQHSVSN